MTYVGLYNRKEFCFILIHITYDVCQEIEHYSFVQKKKKKREMAKRPKKRAVAGPWSRPKPGNLQTVVLTQQESQSFMPTAPSAITRPLATHRL
jgi:hypothetical protein